MNVWFLNLISWHLQGIIFARQNLQSTSPLLDIGNGNWNVLILRQCHVVEFVSYVSQSVQDIYFYSCQSTCTFVCTQLTENTKCVPNCFLFFFMAMFAVPFGKAYMCPFYIYKTHVFVTHILIGCHFHFLHPIRNRHSPSNHGNLVSAAKGGEERGGK